MEPAEKITPEIPKRTRVLVRITSGIVAVSWAGIAILFIHEVWQKMETVPAVLIFALLWIGFYHASF